MTPGPKANKDCKKLEPFLEDYLQGGLPRTTANRLTLHLETCGNCKEVLDDLRISSRLMAGAFEKAADPGSGFARFVMARINTAEHWLQRQTSFWRPFETIAWRLTFSAALLLAFLFAYGIRVNSQPSVTSMSVQQPDIFTVPVSTVPSNSDEVLMAITERHHER